jgi:hypothetical protein
MISDQRFTNFGNKTLFHNEVPNVKRSVGAPAKSSTTVTGLGINQAILKQELLKRFEDFWKDGG